jgi:hypothetical protein
MNFEILNSSIKHATLHSSSKMHRMADRHCERCAPIHLRGLLWIAVANWRGTGRGSNPLRCDRM